VDETTELAAHVRSIAHCLVPVSDNGLCNQSSEVVIVLPADTFYSNCNVGGGDGVVTNSDLGADEIRLRLVCNASV
jgi:hypothetical protein